MLVFMGVRLLTYMWHRFEVVSFASDRHGFVLLFTWCFFYFVREAMSDWGFYEISRGGRGRISRYYNLSTFLWSINDQEVKKIWK